MLPPTRESALRRFLEKSKFPLFDIFIGEKPALEVVYRSCAGIDVHKKTAVVHIRKDEYQETRTFPTLTRNLLEMRDWLEEHQVQQVAIESTGVYWKPVFNLLEGACEVILVNAKHIKNVPGRKTDVKDARWLADLLRHGLLKASFIPPEPVGELRDLTRHRAKLQDQQAAVANRLIKILEDCNIKLRSVVSDIQGKSALHIIERLAAGESSPEQLAQLAQGRLRSKIDELKLALEGGVKEHHRFLLRELLDQWQYLEGAVARAESEIEARMPPFETAAEIWDAIPGINRGVAQVAAAEIGIKMEQFPTAGHLASWVGFCPGHHESAGKQYSGKTTDGNVWLRRALIQAAWSAVRTKNSYFHSQYHRLMGRRGKKEAIVAVAHSLLVVMYHTLKNGAIYQDLGANYFERNQEERIVQKSIQRLNKLGYTVTLAKAA
jgi:transposase